MRDDLSELPEGWGDRQMPVEEKDDPTGLPESRLPQSGPNIFTVRKNILVVDDDPAVRGFVRTVLEAENFRVSEETDSRTFLRNVPEIRVDLILLDIHMPELDGISALNAMRKNVNMTRDIPVIIITAHGDRQSVIRARKAGAADFLLKPLTPEALIEKVGQHLLK